MIYIDSSGADTLDDLVKSCRKNGVRLLVCGLIHQALDIVRRGGFAAQLGPDHLFADLASGMAAAAR